MGYLDYAGLQYLWGKLKEKFAPKSHSHDDRYYTESEMDGKLNSKVNNNEAGANGLFSKLTTSWTATPTDDTYFIRQDTGGGNQFGRVKFSTLWNYIKGKADGTYQPKGNYAASNHSHTKAEVGLSNVDNTADKDKSVKYAASAGSASTGLNGVSTCIFDSSSNNGSCVRFYNGLQICFGNSSKSSEVVFKLPFANDNYAVVVGGSDTLKNAWYVAGSRTTTGFNPTQSGFAVLFHWIAIGNWK